MRTTFSAYVLEPIEASNTCACPPPEVSSGSLSLMRITYSTAADRSGNGEIFRAFTLWERLVVKNWLMKLRHFLGEALLKGMNEIREVSVISCKVISLCRESLNEGKQAQDSESVFDSDAYHQREPSKVRMLSPLFNWNRQRISAITEWGC